MLTGDHLGDIELRLERFSNLDTTFERFATADFRALPFRKRFKEINHTLLKLIEAAPEPAFLLGAVIEYIDRVNKAQLLAESYTFQSFEFWLNQFSKLNKTENARIRGKIAGKHIPREDYQAFFPIGMDKSYRGSHFVAAHLSPDIDTTICSFWGWLDAFAARVSEGLHIWFLPGGAPESHFSNLFQSLFTENAFSLLSRQEGVLNLTAQDLVTKRGVSKRPAHTLTGPLDHRADGKAILLVDEKGYWRGDWRSRDVESARQVVTDFNACLRWFENSLHVKLISLFAKETLTTQDLEPFIRNVFDCKIGECEPSRDFLERQRRHLATYLKGQIGLQKGLHATFGDLIRALSKLSIEEFTTFEQLITDLNTTALFDHQGQLREDRPAIFTHLQKIIGTLDQAIAHSRDFVDRLDMMVTLKHDVLNNPKTYATLQCDVEEMRQRMGNRDYLTVVLPQDNDKLFPVGIVDAEDLRRPFLGTVTLRDFSNEEETRMPPYLEIISVIDHHKITLNTNTPPMALISDAQSSNVLVAEQTFLINDRYSVATHNNSVNPKEPLRIQKRRITRNLAVQERGEHYVHPLREYTEYLSFLYAILDDTDLLAKVTKRDVLCTAELLNRMKSLTLSDEVEVIHFDDILRDSQFTKKAAKRLLQSKELYSIYQTIYRHREESIEQQLTEVSLGLFTDTKEQSGCGRIGQTKLFAANFPTLNKQLEAVQTCWLEQAKKAHTANPRLDLHIHMISTVSGAEEVYQNNEISYTHQDELWLWHAPTKKGHEHFASFLASFRDSKVVTDNQMEVFLKGPKASKLKDLFDSNFSGIKTEIVSDHETELSIAVIRFLPGTINSRKAMISPHLPRVV